LRAVLEATLRLAHPFLPFLTEEVWQALPGTGESIMTAPYPGPVPELRDEEAERRIAGVIDIARAIRNLRAELRTAPGQEVEATLRPLDLDEQERAYVQQAARARLVDSEPRGPSMTASAAGRDVMLALSTQDVQAELKRLRK